MNKLDKQYQDLLQSILDYGVKKQDRTGTGTKSIFGYTIRHNMKDGFPLLTTKKMAWKTMVTELLWFLRGDTNIKYLVDNNCHIWDGDCYKAYIKRYNKGEYVGKTKLLENSKKNRTLTEPFTQEEFINKIKTDDEFAKTWGELGPIYGKQWRSWKTKQFESLNDGNFGHKYNDAPIDQIANLINELKTNPDSRRLMVNAWNVGELDQMVLPPCHYGFQVYTRELDVFERCELSGDGLCAMNEIDWWMKVLDERGIPKRAISLMWNQRSVDTFLGLPFNIASYGLLLEIIAKKVNMIPDELIGNLGDTHIYLNHIEQAKEQIGRDLTDEERYNKWFDNNYETGMERFFDPNNLPDFDNTYFEPTPKRTREPFELPKLKMNPMFLANLEHKGLDEAINGQVNFELENYQSHPPIKAPLSN
jgi:thymidylate synthase